MSFRYTVESARDLADVGDYVSDATESGALRLIDKIEAAIFRLSDFPYLGRVRDDIQGSPRSWTVDDWVILYRILEGQLVEIVRIIHGSRDLRTMLDRR